MVILSIIDQDMKPVKDIWEVSDKDKVTFHINFQEYERKVNLFKAIYMRFVFHLIISFCFILILQCGFSNVFILSYYLVFCWSVSAQQIFYAWSFSDVPHLQQDGTSSQKLLHPQGKVTHSPIFLFLYKLNILALCH